MPSTNSQPNRPRTRSMSLSEAGMENEPVELKTESKKRNKSKDDEVDEAKSSSKSKDKHKSKESSSSREESDEKKSSKRRRNEEDEDKEEEEARDSSDKKKQKSKKMKLDKEADVSESEKEEEREEEEDEGPKLSVKTTPISKFDMSEQTKKVLEKRGIKSLFEIQTLTYQPILDGKDVVGRARTGQGKTLAYCLPIIESLLRRKHDSSRRGRPCAVLILAPTRELAIQIANEFVSVAPHLQSLAVYGGSAYDPQIRALRDGVDAVIGTPGRICDLLDRGNLRLDSLKYLVLDEADQMLDMGFQDEMNKVFEASGSGADGLQTLLFSATLPSWVKSVAMKRMKAPVTTVDLIGEGDVKASTDVDHMCMMSNPQINERAKVINDLLQVYGNLAGDGRAIVFCATKKHCDELATNENLHIEVKAMHGDVMQASRERTLAAFRRGQIKVLIATDVAARGLDIQGVDLVINNGPPAGNLSKRVDAESYVHRSGRTGRAGRKGSCITLFGPFDEHMIKDIERETGNTLRRIAAPQPKDMMIAAAKAASEAIEDVPAEITELFADSAQALMDKMDGDATRTIAACLARLTGFSDLSSVRPRSLLQSAEGYITVQFATRSGKELNGKGLVFASLRSLLGDDAVSDNAVRGLCLTKDSTAALFDLNSKFEKPLREAMKARMRGADEFSFPSELPELQATTTGMRGGDGRGGRGGGGYNVRGGSFHPGRGFFGGRGGVGRGGGGGGFRGGNRFSSRGGRDRDY